MMPSPSDTVRQEPFAPFKFLRINRNSGFSREENNKVTCIIGAHRPAMALTRCQVLDAVCSMGVKVGRACLQSSSAFSEAVVQIGSESDQFIADPNCIHCGAARLCASESVHCLQRRRCCWQVPALPKPRRCSSRPSTCDEANNKHAHQFTGSF